MRLDFPLGARRIFQPQYHLGFQVILAERSSNGMDAYSRHSPGTSHAVRRRAWPAYHSLFYLFRPGTRTHIEIGKIAMAIHRHDDQFQTLFSVDNNSTAFTSSLGGRRGVRVSSRRHISYCLFFARIWNTVITHPYLPWFWGIDRRVSGQGGGDDVEGGGAVEPRGVDGGSDVGFGLCGPHGAIAIGHFSLDHARAEFAL